MNSRKAWMTLLIILSLGLLMSAASAQTVSIADGSAYSGATTTVTITADDVTDLANFDITVAYDPDVVNVTGAVNDAAFGAAVNNLDDAASGSVRLASFNFGAGQTGDGVLLSTLTLEAVGTAGQTSALTLTVNELKDSTEGAIAATTDNGTFTVTVPVINLSISDGSAGTGATTTVTITADNVTDVDLANFDITVAYDPAVVLVTDAANDGAFGSAVNDLTNAASGSVHLASLNLGDGQTGDGILLSTLTLEAVGTAGQTSALTLTVNELKDSTGGAIAATTDNGTFTVMVPVTVPVINLSISDGSAGTGATTTVTITADNVTDVDLANFDITVTYDPAVVLVTDAANDGAFGSAVNNLGNAANGSVRLISLNLGAGQTGDGVLLSTLTLEAVGTTGQTSALTLTVNELKDSTGGAIAATTDNGTFTVMVPVTVPVINLSISDGSAGTGATTTVTITADNVTDVDLANFDITVTYDPTVVIVTDAANDGAFGSAVNNLENAASGSVHLASLNLGDGQTGDDIVLSTLTLEAVGTTGQTSALTLTVNELKTSSEGVITATTDDGVFTVILSQTGDIDGSGEVTMSDAVYLAKHMAGLSGYETIYADGDIDGSGEVTMSDAVYLAKHMAGLSGYEILYP